jgi:ABC-type microcin C transport system permease subunit YejB
LARTGVCTRESPREREKTLKKLIMSGVLVAALAVPATAGAQDPTPSDFKNASKFCKDLKKRSGAANFATLYKNHGKCVSSIAQQTAREDAKQEDTAKKNASQQCREERGTTEESIKAFNDKYGTNKNKKNAFGKCVSQKAKQNKQEADQQDAQQQKATLNAARQCREERGTTEESIKAFNDKYGTNKNKKNAFGKCVSTKAQAQNDEQS